MNFIDYTKQHGYGHIPSALSQLYYINEIFCNKLVVPYEHNIVIGKPFGSCAYYYVWDKMGYIDSQTYSAGVKEYEIDWVDFSDETLGNALGVASGMVIGNGKKTYVNISDSQLQMGSILESIQFIGRHQQKIVLTIDYNKQQLTSNLLTNIDSDISMFENNGWKVVEVYDVKSLNYELFDDKPVVYFVHTKKGDGVIEMENNPTYWHYKPIENETLSISDKLGEV